MNNAPDESTGPEGIVPHDEQQETVRKNPVSSPHPAAGDWLLPFPC